MAWHKAATLARLGEGPLLFKLPPRQIALFRHDERVFAVDNRCPHEGYPLVEGSVDGDGVLTCHWHNWKFRLSDGTCLLGGDHVRTYPTEVRGDELWIDVTDPPREVVHARILAGLRAAFDERDYGRTAREICRLQAHGLAAPEALTRALEWSHDRLEYGTTHAYAAGADWLDLATTYADDRERELICLTEAVDHMAHDALRQPTFPYAQPGEVFEPVALEAALEAGDAHRAEGLLGRGLADGLLWADLEPVLTRVALAHYNDFGHALIYVSKAGQWLRLAGESLERWLLPPLVRRLAFTTREDLLPEFRGYAAALDRMSAAGGSDAERPSPDELFGRPVGAVLTWVVERWGRTSPECLHDALLEVAARHLLHFDARYQSDSHRSVSQNVGWLDFTHAVTFGSAVRERCQRFPEQWPRGLLQMACFAGRNAGFLDRDLETGPWQVDDPGAFWARAHELVLDHGLRDPIFSSHVLKTTRAVEAEVRGASPSCQRWLLAALKRFLQAPLKQKHPSPGRPAGHGPGGSGLRLRLSWGVGGPDLPSGALQAYS